MAEADTVNPLAFNRDSVTGLVSVSGSMSVDVTAGACSGGCSVTVYAFDRSSGSARQLGAVGSGSVTSVAATVDVAVSTATPVWVTRTTDVQARVSSSSGTVTGPFVSVSDVIPPATLTPAVDFYRNPDTGLVSWTGTLTGQVLRGDGTRCGDVSSTCTIYVEAFDRSSGTDRLVPNGLLASVSVAAAQSWQFSRPVASSSPRWVTRVTDVRARLNWQDPASGTWKTLYSPWQPVDDSLPAPSLTLSVDRFFRDSDGKVSWKGTVGLFAQRGDGTRCGDVSNYCNVAVEAYNRQAGQDTLTGTLATVNVPRAQTWSYIGAFDSGYPRSLAVTTDLRARLNWQNPTTGQWMTQYSGWVPVSDWVQSDHDMVQAATLFATLAPTLVDPCIEAFPAGPSTTGSSLNDFQVACESARAAGKSWEVTFKDVIQLAISTSPLLVADLIMNALGSDQRPPTTTNPTPSPLPSPTAPSDGGSIIIGPVLDDTYLAIGTQRMLKRDRVDRAGTAKNYGFAMLTDEEAAARTILTRCVRLMMWAGLPWSDCETKAIFSPGSDVPEAAAHDLDAEGLHPTEWTTLRWASQAEKDADGETRRWYEGPAYADICPSPRPLNAQGLSQDCDEYPFFASDQGGDLPKSTPTPPSLRLVNADQNQREGLLLTGFASYCGLKTQPRHDEKRDYIVVPLPNQDTIPTTGWCRAGAP